MLTDDDDMLACAGPSGVTLLVQRLLDDLDLVVTDLTLG